MRLLSGLLEAFGGFRPIHPSPARGGNPSLTGNIEPKSTRSYTQSLPPSFHSTRFLSSFFLSSTLPYRKRCPFLLQFRPPVPQL